MAKVFIIFSCFVVAYSQLIGPQCPSTNDTGTALPHESDCTKFYVCNWGEPVEFTCPEGTIYGPNVDRCDYEWYAICAVPGGNGTTGPQCPPNNDDVILLPHETDCNRYYKCEFGIAIEFYCPPEQVFGVAINRCDFGGYAECFLGGPSDGSNEHSNSEGN